MKLYNLWYRVIQYLNNFLKLGFGFGFLQISGYKLRSLCIIKYGMVARKSLKIT